jgi:hypothetical protein
VILGIIGLQILDDSGPSSGDASVTTTIGSGGPSGTGTSATSTPLKPNGQVRVKVYNASGVQGTAQTMTDKLKGKGYNMQGPANLSDERAGTIVQCLGGFQREGTLLAGYGIGNGATIEPYPKDPPEGASEADCIVIIGTA